MINKPIVEKAISLPFAIDSYGNVATVTNPKKIWEDRVKSVIGTMIEERVMRPSFGTSVPKLLWDTSEFAQGSIESEVRRAFLSSLPLLELDNVEVIYDEYTNIITANIVYSLPNEEETSVSVGIANINRNNPISEETL